MSVDRILARDRELRAHATARPWHQDGQGIRFRLLGPLPQSRVVVDPYGPNPQDGPLLLHRINTYEELEHEIWRLRDALHDARARIALATGSAAHRAEQDLESLARDLEAGISAALGDRRARIEVARAGRSWGA